MGTRRYFQFGTWVILAGLLVACGTGVQDSSKDNSSPQTPALVGSVNLLPQKISLIAGDQLQLEVELYDTSSNLIVNKTNRSASVVWSSSDNSIATVDQFGLVSAAKTASGQVRITATSEGKSASTTIEVKPSDSVSGFKQISISPARATLPAGNDYGFKLTYLDASNNRAVNACVLGGAENYDKNLIDVEYVPGTAAGANDSLVIDTKTPGVTHLTMDCQGFKSNTITIEVVAAEETNIPVPSAGAKFGFDPDIAIHGEKIHISSWQGDIGRWIYSYFDGSNWTSEVVESLVNVEFRSVIQTDPLNEHTPLICGVVNVNNTNQDLACFQVEDGEWEAEPVDRIRTTFTAPYIGALASAMNSKGVFYLAYYDADGTSTGLKLATSTLKNRSDLNDNHSFIASTAGANGFVDLVVGPDDKPRIAFQDANKLYYGELKNDGKWVFELISGLYGAGDGVKLAIGSDNRPQVVYAQGNKLIHQRKTESGWQASFIAHITRDILDFDIVLDARNMPKVLHTLIDGPDTTPAIASVDTLPSNDWAIEAPTRDVLNQAGEVRLAAALIGDQYGRYVLAFENHIQGSLKVYKEPTEFYYGAKEGSAPLAVANVTDPITSNLRAVAEASTGNIILKWDYVPGSTGYGLYFNESGGVTTEDSLISETASFEYRHRMFPNEAPLVHGNNYHYKLFVENNFELIESEEVTATSQQIWRPFASLPKAIHQHDAALIGRTIYVSGGYDHTLGAGQQSAVYSFDLDNDTEWQNYVSLPGTRRAHEMVAHGDHLYAISGYDELKETNHGVLTLNTAASTPEWIAAPTLITPRRHFSSAVIGDSIFIGTGYSNSPVAGFETIDLSANFPAWSNLTSQASIARYGSDAAVVGDSIYVVGAYYNTPLVNSVDVLDTSDHSITSSVSNPNLVMSSIRFEPEAETLHGNVYVFGGAPSDSLIWSSGEMYSPNNPDLGWRATTPMPTPRNYFAGLEIDDEFYAIGGQRAVSTNTSAVDVYNPKLEPWQDIADLPMARRDHRSVVHNGKVYVIGGQDESKNLLGSVVVYDPASDSWADLGHDLATPRFRHFAITLGDKIYVIGGLANGSSIASVEVLDLNNLSQGWIAGPDLPLGLLNTTGVVYNNMIYLIGGRDDTQTYSSILVLDPVAGAWSSKFDKGHDIVNLSVPRHRANAAIVDGLIYVIGGTVFEGGVNTTYHRTMDIIDPATNTRKVGPPMRIARATHAEALVVDGRILVIGGHGGGPRNENEEYDIASGRWSERRVQRTTRDRFSVAQVEDRVYFIGGRDKGDGVYSLSEVYTPEFETGLDKSTRYSNVTLTGVQVNERVYRPGETVSVQGNAIFVDSGACESNCIEQLWIGINGEPTAQRCLLSAGTPANSSRSGNFNTTLTAPSAPGVYQIAFSRTWQGSCVVDPTWGHFYPPTPSTILGVIRVE